MMETGNEELISRIVSDNRICTRTRKVLNEAEASVAIIDDLESKCIYDNWIFDQSIVW